MLPEFNALQAMHLLALQYAVMGRTVQKTACNDAAMGLILL